MSTYHTYYDPIGHDPVPSTNTIPPNTCSTNTIPNTYTYTTCPRCGIAMFANQTHFCVGYRAWPSPAPVYVYDEGRSQEILDELKAIRKLLATR